ncbi:helix-turn-helix domain-containing protein [Phaeacidiphilus oryzae]|jgi:transcriptional regulator GlxA family with amidase domain|uniref:helix-turn-helix domain-containing protein n=1 Tax=Phaeacidiphilus oryzae TaxID=348818 RepID=UPI000568C790|nr:helix-turn-helix domain-containing protein [Phaeacidiphilus oryzae]
MLRSVAVLLVDGTAPFEFGVVCEVFGLDRTEDGVPAFDFRVCGEHPGRPLSTRVGCAFVPDRGLDELVDADLVCVPAVGTEITRYPPAAIAALREAYERGAIILSVCSGAFLLAEAGLLDGRRCTTHWRHTAALAERYPRAEVDPGVLYVDEGRLITSAGTAAGIDACLHLVRREMGSEVANLIARRMVVPPQRDGGQRQFIDLPVPETRADGLQPLLDWMLEHLDREQTVAGLAKRARMSERTFARRFAAETGSTPLRWLTQQRVLHARRLLEETALDLEEVARLCGLGSGALLRHHFRRAMGVTPQAYRRTFAPRAAPEGELAAATP